MEFSNGVRSEGNIEVRGQEMNVGNKSSLNCSEFMLRLLAFAFTLVAAIVLGVDKQTTVVPIQVVLAFPPLNVPVTAKWNYMSAFVYLEVTNAIACSYGALSLILTLAIMGKKKWFYLMIVILDLVVLVLLFSSTGAATAIGLIGYRGNSHVRWSKVCDVFDKFCHQVAAAIAISLLGSLAYLLLVVLAILKLHKKYE
ncbi:CASP-like protein 1E1 [Cornus florida]|uniref:CASP-like protein 1E1 n=1 Tax=Cornus florida TaxID=4283 RepID=UPI0028A1A813|nr:CASP-like protein 1E1 [Cornus florida]